MKNFIARQQNKLQRDIQFDHYNYASNRDELFAEKFNKFKVRDYGKDNTRMNINNATWSAQQEKRDRMVLYW